MVSISDTICYFNIRLDYIHLPPNYEVKSETKNSLFRNIISIYFTRLTIAL